MLAVGSYTYTATAYAADGVTAWFFSEDGAFTDAQPDSISVVVSAHPHLSTWLLQRPARRR